MTWADHRPEAISWYWDSATEAWRQPVLDVLQRFEPFHTVLDLGCHCGPVRRVMRERFGWEWSYVGLDCNAGALEAARVYAQAQGDTNSTFIHGDLVDAIPTLDQFDDRSFEIVVSCSTLMCLPPDFIEPVLAELKRISSRAVILQEDTDPMGLGKWIDGRGWAHVYPDWVILV